MAATAGRSIGLKLNNPELLDGQQDCLVVNTWLYRMEQYILLVQVSTTSSALSDFSKIACASTFFTAAADVWWLTVDQSDTVSKTWNEFKSKTVGEFAPPDHNRRVRERPRNVKRNSSVSELLGAFHNVTLAIRNVADAEKMDRLLLA